MSYADLVDQDVRLIILRALADENDYTLNESILSAVLETFGHRKSRAYIREQLRFLADDLKAVAVSAAGTVQIARITDTGLDHVAGRIRLEGVKRPSPGL
ncbi:hypothetical protein GGD81_001365 [Rhodobium orientis]|uniref:ArsR family transcriptional regulator n=1 Tax=Rhodobium orientis TaxID=34017 RepID=A0A327JSJ1_9HYPH|nr:hypothetical protein [Rhodobium orientis]MBB4302338.1 hypothetical protein [Rhodobium orientis]MBK5949043.1 hypothetical protein [Rhodobium orientis]RAI29031.1 hypothetical protein CH339_04950 [Rhodobium orientis]